MEKEISAEGAGEAQVIAYLGCNADASHPDGIYVLSVDRKTGGIEKAESHDVAHAVYLCISPDGRILFSCSDNGISSFSVDGAASARRRHLHGCGAVPCLGSAGRT